MTNKSTEGLDNLFNVEPTPIVTFRDTSRELNENKSDIELPEPENLLPDSSKIRNNLKDIYDKANTALESAINEFNANPSSAKHAEAIAKLVEGINKLNTTLLDLNVKEKELNPKKKQNKEDQPGNVTNNTLVVSSSDLLEKILQSRK